MNFPRIPSLKNPNPKTKMNPQHITTVTTNNTNSNRSRTFTTTYFTTLITTTVTSTPAVAREWVYTLRRTHSASLSSSNLTIGLGVQSNPSFTSAATLQLYIPSKCLIFQLSHSPGIPATLRRLLADERITFVGVHNARHKNLLKESPHKLEVANLVDLAKAEKYGDFSMEEMAEEILGFSGVEKPGEIEKSDWDQLWLSSEQVQYACVDAHVSYLLGQALGYDVNDDDDDDLGRFGGFYDDYDDEYFDYDDFTNPLNYNEEGKYDPDNCNPFNFYLSDFEDI